MAETFKFLSINAFRKLSSYEKQRYLEQLQRYVDELEQPARNLAKPDGTQPPKHRT